MKLSTKGRYGLRAMADLAAQLGCEPVSLSSIAQRQRISEGYLESMFGSLRRSGLVRSIKGAGGGYVLMREASEISVGEVLRALEGNLHIVEPEDAEPGSLRACIAQNVWNKVSQRIENVVNSVTLQNLIDSKICSQEVNASAN